MVDEYVVYSLESTTCPPTTSLSLYRKSCCFTSKIIRIGAYCQPYFFSNLVLGRDNWNTPIFSNVVISSEIVSAYKIFSLLLSKRSVSLELLVILYTNFAQSLFPLLRTFLDIFVLRDIGIFDFAFNPCFFFLLSISNL